MVFIPGLPPGSFPVQTWDLASQSARPFGKRGMAQGLNRYKRLLKSRDFSINPLISEHFRHSGGSASSLGAAGSRKTRSDDASRWDTPPKASHSTSSRPTYAIRPVEPAIVLAGMAYGLRLPTATHNRC